MLEELLKNVPGISAVEWKGEEKERTSVLIHVKTEDVYQACRDIFLVFSQAETVLLELIPKKASLEEVFLELSGPDETEKTAGSETEGKEESNERRIPS